MLSTKRLLMRMHINGNQNRATNNIKLMISKIFTIKNLSASIEGKSILNGVDLAGKIALLVPNLKLAW